MKKYGLVILLVALVASISSYLYLNHEKADVALDLINIEALATPEVEVGFCIYMPKICIRFTDDNTFIWGYRQY
ncbi:hypothetical protein [Bacteroides graminisolvens]|uniref:hypothetical protein n=1 Tax=Bacteroides graminisolvens TaxID=477666 RepID=UPI00046AD5F6|nr:hypothetical protein [Bacteroides graminisolvens]